MYKVPFLTVDAVINCKNDSIVLIKRKKNPYKYSWALPGGFVEYGETVENAALREVKEETGLEIELRGIVGVYSDPNRDPRGHTVTICFLANVKGGKLDANTDASEARCILRKDLLNIKLAFDHNVIIKDAFKLMDSKRNR